MGRGHSLGRSVICTARGRRRRQHESIGQRRHSRLEPHCPNPPRGSRTGARHHLRVSRTRPSEKRAAVRAAPDLPSADACGAASHRLEQSVRRRTRHVDPRSTLGGSRTRRSAGSASARRGVLERPARPRSHCPQRPRAEAISRRLRGSGASA
eukprot:6839164-Prymnesium_polylepis.1